MHKFAPYQSCWNNFVAILPDGSKHSFTNGGADPNQPCSASVSDSQDGSFLRLDSTAGGGPILYLKNGIRIYFPSTGNARLATKVVDSNGNVISYQQLANGSIQITDTVGRIVTLTIASGWVNQVTYNNSAGTLNTIQHRRCGI